MPIKVTMKTTVPSGVIPARENPDFSSTFTERHNIVLKRGSDIQLTKTQDELGQTSEVIVESTYPDMATLAESIAEIGATHPDELNAIREYSAANGIVTHRKIVDADTGAVIEDWKVV